MAFCQITGDRRANQPLCGRPAGKSWALVGGRWKGCLCL